MFGSRVRSVRRQEFVSAYELPDGIGRHLQDQLEASTDINIAFRGLNQWLRLHVAAPNLLGMPSRGVDLLWHEFILHTEEYQTFCRQAYGRTLHHSPEASMGDEDAALLQGEGMALTFAMACRDQGIQFPEVLALPLLFTVDATLGLVDGQHWIVDCGHSTCSATRPTCCFRHQLRHLIPKDVPQQRRAGTGKWVTSPFGGLAAGSGISSDSGGHSGGGHGGPGCGGHSCGGGSH